eukprot:5954059-Prymnesium_polylepis.1
MSARKHSPALREILSRAGEYIDAPMSFKVLKAFHILLNLNMLDKKLTELRESKPLMNALHECILCVEAFPWWSWSTAAMTGAVVGTNSLAALAYKLVCSFHHREARGFDTKDVEEIEAAERRIGKAVVGFTKNHNSSRGSPNK